MPPAPKAWVENPRQPAVQQYGDQIQVLLAGTDFRDLVAVDLRYTYGTEDSTGTLPAIGVDDWENCGVV